ncbi:MAG TPA: DUF2238 domain-containing protein [Lentisphaeria bacterium]|nr:DUF2238 domain-containing protein [Lentisphaeria bacterium]HQL87044.1 DUF2238 domain-containing protein [Lentisphaeria bacterium]
MASVFLVTAILAGTFRWFRFSNASYAIVSLWLVMHAIGAHYTFEKVPFGLVTDLFGFERNHYDRVAHYVVGLNSFLAAEFLWRRRWVATPLLAAAAGVCLVMAMAAGWEIIEWLYAVADGGQTGIAFLGAQGDPWDAQKDMLADTLGAITASAVFLIAWKKAPDSPHSAA